MAKRKTATVSHVGKDVVVVTPPAQSAPVRRRRGAGAIVRRKGGRRRRSSGGGAFGGGGASFQNKMMATGVGGLMYGFVEKMFPNLPTIPVIGKSGTIALACYFFGPKHGLIRDVGVAAAAIAGYSFGKTGVISGHGGFEEE